MSVSEEIHELVRNWHAATKAGDVDAVMRLMTDDVIFFIPGRSPMARADFEAMSRRPNAKPPADFESSCTIREIQVSGDMACMWTDLSVKFTPPGASKPVERSGNTLTMLRRENGKWLIARDASLLATIQRAG